MEMIRARSGNGEYRSRVSIIRHFLSRVSRRRREWIFEAIEESLCVSRRIYRQIQHQDPFLDATRVPCSN